MERGCSVVKSPAHLFESNEEETDWTQHMTSDGLMEEERDATPQTTSDGLIEEERDATPQTTSDGLIEEERDATPQTTSDGLMEEERGPTLQTTSDGLMEEERDSTQQMTSDGLIEEERDATQQMTNDGLIEEERDATQQMTSDGLIEEERDATPQTTSDGLMEEERGPTLQTTSDGLMEEVKHLSQHMTSDGLIEEDRYATLQTSNELIEEERDWIEEPDCDEELDEASETEDNTEFNPDYRSTDEEEFEVDVPAETDTAYISKNGNILWTPIPPPERHGRSHLFMKTTPGPTWLACSNAQDVKSTFELFFPGTIRETVIQMSNLEGKRVFGAAWKDLDWMDLQAFIGLLILAGVYRSHRESMNSLWHGETGRPIFRATMALRTFCSWSRVICFSERSQKRDDKLAPIRNIWDKWVERLPLLYNPGPNVTVDESLVPFRGRCPFKQYMPSKPAKYGINIWAACDARSSYAWNMRIYTGKAADRKSKQNQLMHEVLDMTSGLQGHSVTCDNVFTSYALGEELLQREITMVGPIRSNKPELPPALSSVKGRTNNSPKFAFTDTHTLVSYCPRKKTNVLLMSTLHRGHNTPQIILDYNKTKGGVDNLSKLISTYTCQRKTIRWPMVIFLNMLDVSAYNAFVLWTEINPGRKIRRRMFLEELGRALVTPLMLRREGVPRTPNSKNMMMEVQEVPEEIQRCIPPISDPTKRKRCEPCRRIAKKKDTKTSTTCDSCHMYICKAHAVITTLCCTCSNQ